MEGLANVFENLTGAQAEVISAATTLFSALLVAIVAPVVFHLVARGRVTDFNQAVGELKKAAERAKDQSDTIGKAMSTITTVASGVTELGVLVASVQETLANTQNTLLEAQPEQTMLNGNGAIQSPETHRDQVRRLWRGLQEFVERQASDPGINGNTRAKYARIDRRGYLRLVELLHSEGNLTGDIVAWREAYALASSAAHSNVEPTQADVQRMEHLAEALQQGRTGVQTVPASLPLRAPARPESGFGRTLRTPAPRLGPRMGPKSEQQVPN